MSGFVSELSVFLGLIQSDAYSAGFKVIATLLAGVGLILTPIYLLSMLRVVFYGKDNSSLTMEPFQADANFREIFIALCLLIPIVGIGLYPKLATNTYDLTTVEIASKTRSALTIIAQTQETITNKSLGKLISTTVGVAPEI
jgi:NAD(P)H-quinone oxidoreductase subunit 4